MSTPGGSLIDPRTSSRTTGDRTELVTGIHHVAVVTADLDRLAAFYEAVFDAERIQLGDAPDLRHAVLRVGMSWLHAFEMDDNPHTSALPEIFRRGHVDHLGLHALSEEAFLELRRRLVQHEACDGSVTDYGPLLSVWFEDPDGMGSEVCWTHDPEWRGGHEPRRFTGYDD